MSATTNNMQKPLKSKSLQSDSDVSLHTAKEDTLNKNEVDKSPVKDSEDLGNILENIRKDLLCVETSDVSTNDVEDKKEETSVEDMIIQDEEPSDWEDLEEPDISDPEFDKAWDESEMQDKEFYLILSGDDDEEEDENLNEEGEIQKEHNESIAILDEPDKQDNLKVTISDNVKESVKTLSQSDEDTNIENTVLNSEKKRQSVPEKMEVSITSMSDEDQELLKLKVKTALSVVEEEIQKDQDIAINKLNTIGENKNISVEKKSKSATDLVSSTTVDCMSSEKMNETKCETLDKELLKDISSNSAEVEKNGTQKESELSVQNLEYTVDKMETDDDQKNIRNDLQLKEDILTRKKDSELAEEDLQLEEEVLRLEEGDLELEEEDLTLEEEDLQLKEDLQPEEEDLDSEGYDLQPTGNDSQSKDDLKSEKNEFHLEKDENSAHSENICDNIRQEVQKEVLSTIVEKQAPEEILEVKDDENMDCDSTLSDQPIADTKEHDITNNETVSNTENLPSTSSKEQLKETECFTKLSTSESKVLISEKKVEKADSEIKLDETFPDESSVNVVFSPSFDNSKSGGAVDAPVIDLDSDMPSDKKTPVKRAADNENIASELVEVKKVKLDHVFCEKTFESSVSKTEIKQSLKDDATDEDEHKEKEIINIGDMKPSSIDMEDATEKVDPKDIISEEKCSATKEEILETKEDKDIKESGDTKMNGLLNDTSAKDNLPPTMRKEKITLTETELEDLVLKKVYDFVLDDQKNTIADLVKRCAELEKALEKSKKKVINFQKLVTELMLEQQRQLSKNGIMPKVPTRTVGVNVRIMQEHEIQPSNRMRVGKENFGTILHPASTSGTGSLTTNMQLAQATAKKCILPRVPVSSVHGPRLPAPHMASSAFTAILRMYTDDVDIGRVNDDGNKGGAPVPMQLIANTATGMGGPTGVMNKPRFHPSILSRQPITKSPSSVASSAPIVVLTTTNAVTSASSSINVIDLTEDGDSTTTTSTLQSAVILSAPGPKGITGTAVTSSNNLSRVNFSAPSTNLVSLPLVTSLPNVVQLIPSGPHMSPVPGGSAIRVTRPPGVLPQNLPQGSRVTYLVPQTPGSLAVVPRLDTPVSQIATIPTPQQTFVSGSGQPLPTILLRMNPPPTSHVPPVSAAQQTISTAKPVIPQAHPPVLPPGGGGGGSQSSTMLISCVTKHPAPLPQPPVYPASKILKSLPPKPALKISKVSNGIVLSWNMSLFNTHADISTYQLFAYQEGGGPVSSALWKKVGDVKALPLPMACTLTQFVEGHKYHFAVRAVDAHNRLGPFSDPASILLLPRGGGATVSK